MTKTSWKFKTLVGRRDVLSQLGRGVTFFPWLPWVRNANPLSLLVDQSSSKYWVGRAKLPGVIVHVFLGEILIRHAVTAMTPQKHLK